MGLKRHGEDVLTNWGGLKRFGDFFKLTNTEKNKFMAKSKKENGIGKSKTTTLNTVVI